eukprot:135728-Prymnesium_polylepis.1
MQGGHRLLATATTGAAAEADGCMSGRRGRCIMGAEAGRMRGRRGSCLRLSTCMRLSNVLPAANVRALARRACACPTCM